MLLNRVLETARALRLDQRLLRRRAHLVPERVPVVLIPSILGTHLVDGAGDSVWGRTRRLYRGPRLDAATGSRGLLDGFDLIPGVLAYDVYGGLVRCLERAGGYTPGEDLFVLDYDWRAGIAAGAAALQALVDQIRGIGDERVDLVGVSTGGVIARLFQADSAAAGCIRRCVYVGTPQRGSFHVLELLANGVQPAPFGRHFSPAEIATFQTAWDCLPHPDEPVFVDDRGEPVDLALYDADTWVRVGLSSLGRSELAEKLGRASALHAQLDGVPPHPDCIVIAGRSCPTAVRARVTAGRVAFPPCEPRPGDPLTSRFYSPGDGSVPEATQRALPGLSAERIWWVSPRAHHRLPAEPEVHRLVLEALLATARPIPPARLPERGRLGQVAR